MSASKKDPTSNEASTSKEATINEKAKRTLAANLNINITDNNMIGLDWNNARLYWQHVAQLTEALRVAKQVAAERTLSIYYKEDGHGKVSNQIKENLQTLYSNHEQDLLVLKDIIIGHMAIVFEISQNKVTITDENNSEESATLTCNTLDWNVNDGLSANTFFSPPYAQRPEPMSLA